jgi:hypothetical protein
VPKAVKPVDPTAGVGALVVNSVKITATRMSPFVMPAGADNVVLVRLA